MSNDTTNIQKEPEERAFMSINFSDLEVFNKKYFSIEEIVLMQYLLHHRSTLGEWAQSTAEIVKKLGIREKRFESIRAKFIAQNWIRVEKPEQTNGSRYIGTYRVQKNTSIYKVNFDVIYGLDFRERYYDMELIDERDKAETKTNVISRRDRIEIVFRRYLSLHQSRQGKVFDAQQTITKRQVYEVDDLPFL